MAIRPATLLCLLLYSSGCYCNLIEIVSDSVLISIETILTSGVNLKDSLAALLIQNVDVVEEIQAADNNPDKYLNISQLITKYGFAVKNYTVETEDGYLLSLYNIVGDGEPILIVHGLTSSAVDWLTVGYNKALPYLLAEAGYNVWMLNVRGCVTESRGHVNISATANPKQYWNFSWDEIGRYDLPATIDYILELTGKSKLYYVGHSQGTTAFLVLCSVRPEYNDKILLSMLLAPIGYMYHMFSPVFKVTSLLASQGETLGNLFGYYMVDLNSHFFSLIKNAICGETLLATVICENVVNILTGFDYLQMNATNLLVEYSHSPASAATKQFNHYGQIINSKRFCEYDYGETENLVRYNSSTPPDYPLAKITAPVSLVYAVGSDWFSAYEDVERLKSGLPNVVDYCKVPYATFSHTDYLWAKDIVTLVYSYLLALLKKY